MKSASNIVLKLLGLLLLTGAALKGWQLLTEPMANSDIWTNRAFLIFTVEFELALGIWLLSGLFKKLAWLATLACFSMFAVITLYKGISGAESCGCFGSVHVNPWITLFAIDIPSILALTIFRQKHESEAYVALGSVPCNCKNYACQECKCQDSGYWVSLAGRCKYLYEKYTTPFPSLHRLIATVCFGFIILATAGCVLAFNEPAKVTGGYEVLEPETWVGKELPVLEYIDIGKQIKTGTWLVLFYHYDCPDCITAIQTYEQVVRDTTGNNGFLKIAFIEVPPYGQDVVNIKSDSIVGKLSDRKDWFITTPAVVLLNNGIVRNSWEEKTPDINAILRNIAMLNEFSITII